MGHPNDVEKSAGDVSPTYDDPKHGYYHTSENAVPGESFEYGTGLYAKLQRFAGKFNVEQRGIERVPENERTDSGFRALLNVSTMVSLPFVKNGRKVIIENATDEAMQWLSANMVVSSFAIGVLGISLTQLGVADAMLTILFFNLLGIMPVCFFSTFGPRFGLRQMVLSRFWFGWWGVKLIAVFNVLACIGWSAVNSIVGAQLINAVNSDVPGYAGILIISLCTLGVTIFGYKIVHAYEFWSWIPSFIVFMIVLGVFAHSGDFVAIPMGVGSSELSSVMSFGSIVFGFATGWTSYAADYTVYQPATQSRRKVFFWTWLGLIVPLLFTEMLGVALFSATKLNGGDNRYATGYGASGNGGLLGAVLIYHLGTFGKFCLVVLALSIVANNCPNIYSVALTVQVLSTYTQRVPRFIWTAVGTGVYIAIAIPAYTHFEVALEYFMDFIGYWLAIYEGISLTDHFVFKRSMNNYRVEDYTHPELLPPGIAAVLAFCCGIAGMVTGMSQAWYIGAIAKHVGSGPYGGDVGFELSFAFAAVGYLILRPIELRIFKR